MTMLETKKPVWAEGVLLGQQHFQSYDEYNEALHIKRTQITQAYAFGFDSLKLDNTALNNGIINIYQLKVLLENGRYIEFNRSHQNELKLELPADESDITVYLAIASNHAVENIEGYLNNGQLSAYRASYQDVPDSHDQSRIREVMVAEPNLVLLKDSDMKTYFDVIPIVSVQRGSDGNFEVNGHFIPPLLNIAANNYLQELLTRTSHLVSAKVKVLLNRRLNFGSVVEFGPSEMNTFLLLSSLMPLAKRLEHINKIPLLHPERLYCELVELVSKASLFEHGELIDQLPEYNHKDLYSVFEKIDTVIQALLEGVVPKKMAGLKLDKISPAIYQIATIDPSILDSSDFYIAVDFQSDNTKWIETFAEQVKVGSSEHVELIVASALDGVKVTHSQRPPNKLAVKSGYEYFKIESHGYFWQQVLEELSLSIFVPYSIQNAQFDIVCVERY